MKPRAAWSLAIVPYPLPVSARLMFLKCAWILPPKGGPLLFVSLARCCMMPHPSLARYPRVSRGHCKAPECADPLHWGTCVGSPC